MARLGVGVIVCAVIVAMDVAAGILSMKAETAKNKVQRDSRARCTEAIRDDAEEEEEEEEREAFNLGLAAAALQAAAHIVANLLGGCMCICCAEELERSTANRQFWFACLISSWIVVAVGFPMLIIGLLESSKSSSSSSSSCGMMWHNHLLLMGGVLCYLHALLCIALYVSVTFSSGHGSSTVRHQPQNPEIFS